MRNENDTGKVATHAKTLHLLVIFYSNLYKDSSRCAEVAARLDCGTAWVNQHLNIAHTTPFGGSKHSGLGREHGKWGLSAFVEPQTVNVRKDKDAAYSSKSKL